MKKNMLSCRCKLQAETRHPGISLINACLNDARELIEPVSQLNKFHMAVVDGKNEFLI